jgi:hypothetical protein
MNRLLLGFMLITAFTSLWISNAASCSMILPMIYSVIEQLVVNDSTYHKVKRTGKNHLNLISIGTFLFILFSFFLKEVKIVSVEWYVNSGNNS